MLVFSLLAKAVEKVNKSNQEMLEDFFAQRGCSKNSFDKRLELMRLHLEEMDKKCEEQQRKVDQDYYARKQKEHGNQNSRHT